jgi:hypothetical protein
LKEALRRGGHSVASECSVRALNAMKRNLPRVRVFTCPGEMREKEAIAAAIGYEVMNIRLRKRPPPLTLETLQERSKVK